jgi:hypothetical protein
MKTLRDLLIEQKQYNDKIREETYVDREHTREEWTQTYILGLVSEIDEILREIKWKRHTGSWDKKPVRSNIAVELADITKYILSLWELWGFTDADIVEYVSIKNEILNQKYKQDYSKPPRNSCVLICDIDGTLADYRRGFIAWLVDMGEIDPTETDSYESLLMDTNIEMSYPAYEVLKESFEEAGGYANLPPYVESISTLRALKSLGVYIIVYTARPVTKHKRIWYDTWKWLRENNIPADELHIGSEDRILKASSLQKTNKVFIFDDDPSLIRRAANSGLTVYAKSFPYNTHINHNLITFVNDYTDINPSDYIGDQNGK